MTDRRIKPKVGRVGLQVSTTIWMLVADFPAAAWVRVISFGDVLVLCGVADNTRAAAYVYLRPARKVELVADLCVRLRIAGKLGLLWMECRRRDRVRAASLKHGRVGASFARDVAAMRVLQVHVEWVPFQGSRPPSVRFELWLDARRVGRVRGLVAECAGAAVEGCQVGPDPHAFGRVGLQCERQVCPFLAATVVAAVISVPEASVMRPQANAMAQIHTSVSSHD